MDLHGKGFAGLLLAGLAVVLFAGCGGDAPDRSTDGTSATSQVLTVKMSELKFEPASITVQMGQPVRLTAQNVGTADHDWVIRNLPATGVKNRAGDDHGATMQAGMIMADTKPGRAATIEFTPTTTGTFDIYCSKPGHTEAGMTGVLRVE